jgi:hypothetical protein
MPNSFLVQYVRDQFGFVPSVIPEEWSRAALIAYQAQKESIPQ